jgi:hypothetical protein
VVGRALVYMHETMGSIPSFAKEKEEENEEFHNILEL